MVVGLPVVVLFIYTEDETEHASYEYGAAWAQAQVAAARHLSDTAQLTPDACACNRIGHKAPSASASASEP